MGTNLGVVNNNQLASQGIMVSLSNPSGDPPFSGTMSISTSSSTQPGSYAIVLSATGDDPSISNATYILSVLSPASSTTTAATTSVSGGGQSTTIQQTTSQPSTTVQQQTTIPYNYNTGGGIYSGATSGSNTMLVPFVLAILIILGTLYGLRLWKSMLTRLIIFGTALILIGTVDGSMEIIPEVSSSTYGVA